MKNFVALNLSRTRATQSQLIDLNGVAFDPYTVMRDHLVSMGYANNTIYSYMGHVSRFLDYIFSASNLQPAQDAKTLEEIILSYESYLLHGANSSNEIARDTALILPKVEATNPSSLPTIEAAILIFLQLSDVVAEELDEPGLFSGLFPNTVVQIKDSEKARIRCGSMLGSVIRGGALRKRKKGYIFKSSRRSRSSNFRKTKFAFPIERGIDLINATKPLRDKALYALLLSSGCRTAEAMQVRIEDIDTHNQAVSLVNPFARKNKGLTESEHEALDWKGRSISDTFLIEPYASLFFKYLSLYLKSEEYSETCGHSFVFQISRGKNKGRPLFFADRSSLVKQFRMRAQNIGITLPKGVARHSLRHAYGVFTLNYLPTPTGFGLPLSYVSHLMGHASIESTKVYAKHEEEVIRAELEYANRLLIGNGNILSKKEMLINFYEQKLQGLKGLKTIANTEEAA